MGTIRKQAKWDCTDEGILSVVLPSGLKDSYDITKIFHNWANFTPAEKFYAGYGVKQKLSDHCAASKDATYTDAEKITRMDELFNYTAENAELPKTERKGGFGISKKSIAKKIEKREAPLTEDQIALMKELGLM